MFHFSIFFCPSSLSVSKNTLENHIHRIEMNMMEADHVKRKYLSIRASLLDDGVEFESSLQNMEELIVKQEQEIKHLEVVLYLQFFRT